jgi:heme/copper-type cytochrome/quinol oxidase subunit 1
MHLIELMDRVPLWLVGLIVMIVAQTYAIGLMLLTRSIFGVSRLPENNEVAGFKFAVVGVFYAVLLAFVVVAVWEEYRNTETAVRNEAKAPSISTMSPSDFTRRTEPLFASAYSPTQTTSANSSGRRWPAARRATRRDLDQLSSAIFQIRPKNLEDLALYQNVTEIADGDCRQ